VQANAAFRTATSVYELLGSGQYPFEQALRVVLTRLGNFPSHETRADVQTALPNLPLALATEELELLDERTVVVNNEVLKFTNFQHELWQRLSSMRRIALSAPTSAGKSFVFENYLVSLFGSAKPRSVVYLVPTRALITQVAIDLAEYFQDVSEAPEILTVPLEADASLSPRAIYVMTQERVQLALSTHPSFQADVIVVDEAQSIADGARGVLLQWILDDLLARTPTAQILFASPNVRNLDVFGKLFGLLDILEIFSSEPTVAQNFLVVGVESATKGRIAIHRQAASEDSVEVAQLTLDQSIASRTDKLVHVAAKLGQGNANIVYANGAAEAEKIALQLADLFNEREPSVEQVNLSDLAKEVVHPNYVLAECIKRGVAFHYSNIPTQLRRSVEEAVSRGHVDYLVCTSTLLQGVNLPVKNIFMCAPEKGRTQPLDSTDFWNLAGRAGRLRREFQGNIFLIDYANWKKKPLDGPKDTIIVPAIESTVTGHEDQLVSLISNETSIARRDDPALETVFVRLYTDHKNGALETTLSRAGVSSGDERAVRLSDALIVADSVITLPSEVIRLTPSVSAHKQQALFSHLLEQIYQGEAGARRLLPRHPRESEAFQSYADILKLCHGIILGIDTTKNLHRFHALIALKWVRGLPLPRIIEDQIRRRPSTNSRTTIRATLELIETQIRFQAVRLFGCYNSLLQFALRTAGFNELAASIPSLPLFLEVGASDRTMISFMALGLSRVTAMRLNDLSARKDLDVPAALQWLRTRSLDSLGLSPLLAAEIRALISG